MTAQARLLSPTSPSSQYEEVDANGTYVPPQPRFTTVRVQTNTDEDDHHQKFDDYDDTQPREPVDVGFKAFPPIIVMPGRWTLALLVLVGVVAALAFTVLKRPLESIGITSDHLVKYGSIPLISVVFTYVHIWAALWMTFYPLDYFGILQIPGTNAGLGWQGIVPFRAEKMARMATRLMTERLFDVREIFSRIDPQQIAERLGPAVRATLEEAVDRVARANSPELWAMVPTQIKRELVNQAQKDAPAAIAALMRDMQSRITEVLDIEDLVVTTLVRDKPLLTNIFIQCGHAELSFIRNAGAWMGGLFGLVQMAIWIGYQNKWLLPAFGLVVGTLTNWLALKMIFEPIQPRYPCGPRGLKIQGLFLQRQAEVSVVYAKTIAAKVLTSSNILASLFDRLFALIYSHVQGAIDKFAGMSRPLVSWTIGGAAFERAQEDMILRLLEDLPPLLVQLEAYTDRVLDIETTLREKMAELPSEEFEDLLHPIFKADEWKLIVMGGVLGVVIGFAQIEMLGA